MPSFSAMKPPEDNERIMIDSMPESWRGGVDPTDSLNFLTGDGSNTPVCLLVVRLGRDGAARFIRMTWIS
jgi:hypothetical protein